MTQVLPTINAIINATAAVLLVWGYVLIAASASSSTAKS